jgi:hypothetical protein
MNSTEMGPEAIMIQDTKKAEVVAICDSRASAEAAVVALHREGLDLKRILIGGDAHSTEQHILDSVKDGEFLVLVRGTADMIVHARAVLGTTGSAALMTHDAADDDDSRITASPSIE